MELKTEGRRETEAFRVRDRMKVDGVKGMRARKRDG